MGRIRVELFGAFLVPLLVITAACKDREGGDDTPATGTDTASEGTAGGVCDSFYQARCFDYDPGSEVYASIERCVDGELVRESCNDYCQSKSLGSIGECSPDTRGGLPICICTSAVPCGGADVSEGCQGQETLVTCVELYGQYGIYDSVWYSANCTDICLAGGFDELSGCKVIDGDAACWCYGEHEFCLLNSDCDTNCCVPDMMGHSRCQPTSDCQ